MFDGLEQSSIAIAEQQNAGNGSNAVMEAFAREANNQRIALPRRPGESRFAPPQYYYEASKTGVVPSWVTASAERSGAWQPELAVTSLSFRSSAGRPQSSK